jgi:cytochrome c-type biogenesis protein CcmH
MKRLVLFALLLLSTALPAGAVQPGEQLADPVLEARARTLSREIRCLVCQNESIDDSEADLAHDLRVIVRERILAGDNDEQVKAFLVARYGDFVLLKPPVKPSTLALWFGPFAVLALAAAGAGFYLRRRQVPEAAPLGPAERAELDRLLSEEEQEERPKA